MLIMPDINISVIIPVYNVEDYLHVCINSLLKQSYPYFEIICIDDASTDSSLEILEYFSKKDSRIKIIKNEVNRGPGYSRNKGLNIACGKYVSFLDGDDWFSLNAFEILIENAEKNNLDVLMFKAVVYYDDPQEFDMERYYDMDFMDKWDSKIFNHWDLDKKNIFKMPNAPWNKLYLKSFLDENYIRFPNENIIYEDVPFFHKVIISAKKVSMLNQYIHNRRRRQGSIMTLSNRILDNIDLVYKILDVFLEDSSLYEYYKKELLNYIFVSVLDRKYKTVDKRYEKSFFIEITKVYQNFINNYGLYEDIMENIDKKILKKFNVI